MDVLKLGVIKEAGPGERRVAVTPESVGRLSAAGFLVLVERDAGAAAWYDDGAYEEAGAELVTNEELDARAEVLVTVAAPPLDRIRAGQVVVGMTADPATVRELDAMGVTALSLDRLPRTLSSAQPMDALTSQANVAGYKAAVLAADTYERFLPMLVTAAGTARPARVLVLGAGVAGLQAMSTARRLGAVVTGYDVRPNARQEVTSVGASFLELTSVRAMEEEDGYATDMTAEQEVVEQQALADQISRHDIVITTARVPGHSPPLLVTGTAVKAMRRGSVVVDLASSELGGNVEDSLPEQTVVTENGVTIIGAGNLPATMPAAASTAYSHNITAVLLHLVRDGRLTIDPDDPIQAAIVVARPERREGQS